MSLPWMPLWIADYLGDTQHLDAKQSGAYLHLLFHYWLHRSIPKSDRSRAQIAKVSEKEWSEIAPILKKFFVGNFKSHVRADTEYALALKKHETAVKKGSSGGRAKAEKERIRKLSYSSAKAGLVASGKPSSTISQPHKDPIQEEGISYRGRGPVRLIDGGAA